jgi:hypothetical protein
VSVTVAQLYQRRHLEGSTNGKVESKFSADAGFMPEVARILGSMADSQLCISLSSSDGLRLGDRPQLRLLLLSKRKLSDLKRR